MPEAQRLKTKSNLENLDWLATRGLNLATEIVRLMEKMPEYPNVTLIALVREYAYIKKWCEDQCLSS